MSETGRMVPLADAATFKPTEDGLTTDDPLGFKGYREAAEASDARWGESVAVGPATISGYKVELALFDFSFMGGSMGEVAGERLARGLERAARWETPFVLRVVTGGARMQEGMAALVQMPKVVVARLALARAHVPFIVVLGDPTTGGVLASLAGLADLTIAESGATVGFAGPRVVKSFTGKAPTRKSHRAESAFDNGLVDEVVAPDKAKAAVTRFLVFLSKEDDLIPVPPTMLYGGRIDAWDAVRSARAATRPRGRALVEGIADGPIVELRGDRQGVDDSSLIAAFVRMSGRKTLVLALDHRPPGPGAYRKARRALEIAGRLRIPVTTIVDTPGADPSPASENAGVAWEISKLFADMLTVPIPIISIVTGEGGSGGALAFAVGNRLLIYRDAIFSVIGPEAAAEILWRDTSKAPEAARLQRLTAHDLQDLGIADEVVESEITAEGLASVLAYHLARLDEERAAGGDWAISRQRRWRNPRD